MATLSHIAVHPVKSLDPVSRERVGITDIGGLAGDRTYALVDADGEYVNGKRTDAVHRLRTDVALESDVLTIGEQGRETEQQFHLRDEREQLESWLTSYFGFEVRVRDGIGGSQTDGVVYGDESRAGPTLVSRATLREVASWFEGVTPTEMRLRLRPNLVVEGVPAFWEDRLFSTPAARLRIGTVTLDGTRPIPRCVVPTRDPHTGEAIPNFREQFINNRRGTLPEWTDTDAFDGNFYTLMTGLSIPESERAGELRVGDSVELLA